MPSAREYRPENIRNIVVLGHGGSGKTSLVDALCYVSGSTSRHGSVREGTALTMHTPEEVEHGISLRATPAFAEWRDTKLNLLDTPGYLDFAAEALAATRVADGAVVVVGATSGVEVGTERSWEYCEQRKIPRLFFVSMMDRDHADFDRVYGEIETHLTGRVVPVEIPIGSGSDFRGIINLFSGRAHIYRPESATGEYDESEIPEEKREKFERWRTELLETIATTDDVLLERYLDGESITRGEALDAMQRAMGRAEIFPLFCGAPERTWGTRALLSKLVELIPSPADAPPVSATRPGLEQEVVLRGSDDDSFAALIFKTTSEPHVGELSFFRIYGGSIASGSEVYNAGRDATEKVSHLAVPLGRDRIEISRLHSGDIGVVPKLKNSHTNDTLSSAERPLILEPIEFPEPDIAVALRAATRGDEDRISTGLHRLHEEDPVFRSEFVAELKQTIARGLGELHLEVQVERLKRRYGVDVTTEPPRIAYRETIRRTAEAQGKHKKQSGGRGQFGDCSIRLTPRPRGAGYQFGDSIKGGVIPGKYIPSVDRGIREAAARGVLAGYPVVDFLAECYDGSYHPVDSSDIAFQIAGSLAFKAAARAAGPVLLEPILEVEVVLPEEYLGDVIGDLNQRRGRILGMETVGRKAVLQALVPEAELYRYATALRSITHGRAAHRRSHHGYEEVPSSVAGRVLEEASRREDHVAART